MAYNTQEERLKVKGSESITRDLQVTGDVYVGGDLTVNNSVALTEADKGVSNGVASLDATGRVPYSQLPESAMEYKGTWDASTNTPTLADGTGTNGDFYIVSVAGTVNLGTVANPRNVTFYVNDRVIYDGTLHEWERLPAAEVRTVNGQTGDVVLTANDINYDSNTTVKTQIDNAEANAKCLDNATGVLDITHGGTGATCAADARACLGLGDIATINTNNCTTEFLRGDGIWAPPSSVASCADCGKNGSNYCAFGTAAFCDTSAFRSCTWTPSCVACADRGKNGSNYCAFGTNAFNSTAFTTCTGTVTVSNISSNAEYPIALCTGATAIGRSTCCTLTFNPRGGGLKVYCVYNSGNPSSTIFLESIACCTDAKTQVTSHGKTSGEVLISANSCCQDGSTYIELTSATDANTHILMAFEGGDTEVFCIDINKNLHLHRNAKICYDL